MARSIRLDWLAAVVGWGALCAVGAAVAMRGLLVDEAIATVGGWGVFLGGLALRGWMRHRPISLFAEQPDAGLTTGEMTAERLEAMEARIHELEERLELTERLLAEARDRPRIPARERTPV